MSTRRQIIQTAIEKVISPEAVSTVQDLVHSIATALQSDDSDLIRQQHKAWGASVDDLVRQRDELIYAVKVAIKRLEEIQYQKASPKQLEYLRAVISRSEGKKS